MTVLFLLCLIVPGLMLSSMCIRNGHGLLLALPFSLLLYVLIGAVLIKIDKTSLVVPGYLTIGFTLIAVTLLTRAFRIRMYDNLNQGIAFFPILVVLLIYHWQVGAMVDHGIDVFRHMAFVQNAIRHMGEFAGEMTITLRSGTNNFFFHNITASLLTIGGVSMSEGIEIIAVVYSSVWTLSIFLFSRYIFALNKIEGRWQWGLGYLSVALYWMTFGINNFSFPRYYIGGPAILNYCVYLSMTVVSIEIYRHGVTRGRLFLIAVLVHLAGFLHPQEALLWFTFIFSLSIVLFSLSLLGQQRVVEILTNTRTMVLSLVAICCTALAIAASIYMLPKYPHDPISLYNLGEIASRFGAWNILRPNHQLYTVLGYWGIYVMILGVVFWRYSLRSAFILTALLYPIVTVLNPIVAEAIMKLSYPQVLWRVLFGLHLPIVVCLLLFASIENWRQLSKVQSLVRTVLFIPLLMLLVPFKVSGFHNTMTKTISLARTPDNLSYRHWQAPLNYIENLEGVQKVLTDPVTSYAIRSLTGKYSYGHKFFPHKGYRQINFASYDNHPLAKYKNWLLFINLDNGAQVGRFHPPFHVYPDLMQTEKYYTPKLLSELEENPHRYELIWQAPKQKIFRIR